MKRVITLSLAVLSVSATAAMAHNGVHDFSFAGSLFHLISEPDHLAMMGFTAAIGYALWRWHKSRA
jgi:hydrogenase/urease accessory protein HupE